MARTLQKLKSVDFFKKLPADLTEATLAGAWISISAAVVMGLLLVMEISSFMRLQTATELVVDRSKQHELLRVNFNISFPALSCEFATLDVSDSLGTKRMNLTRTVRKTPISLDLQHLAAATDDIKKAGPKYDEDGAVVVNEGDISEPLSKATFEATLAKYPIVVVNFFAPWCHWCQRLAPTWEAATAAVHQRYPEWDGRIRFAKVDCTKEMDMCRQHFIQGFPSIRVFRKGHDDIVVMGHRDHEAYIGDRTLESFLAFADTLAPSAGMPHHQHASLTKAPKSNGCNLAGFVMVKKVPGTLHFTARGDGHSFEHTWMNMTHVVHAFNYGTRPTARKLYQLQKLHPLGLSEDWADKLQGQQFISEHTQDTHEHYMQVVLTTVEPKRGGKGAVYDAYEYTAHSHTYVAESIPVAKFTYTMSPIQIVVRETRRAWYHFLTTTCAIIGGVFTVAGILDGIWYQSMKLAKKVELGKQG